MKAGSSGKLFHVFTLIVLVVIVAVGAMLAYPFWRRNQALRRQEAELRGLIEERKREIAQLAEYQRRFAKDPDFVESIARRNRRVFPGEIVFIFED